MRILASSKWISHPFLTTNKLGFRCWTNDDFELAVDLWGDPEVTRLIDSRSPLSEDQIRDRLSKKISTECEHGIQCWPIFLLKSDEHVGCCGLRQLGFRYSPNVYYEPTGLNHPSYLLTTRDYRKSKAETVWMGWYPLRRATRRLRPRPALGWRADV
jgi:hypothetical protein